MPDLSAKDILLQYQKPVWNKIQKYLADSSYPNQFSIPSVYQSVHNFHWELVRNYPTRLGKYLRPTLVLLTAESLGIDSEKALLTATAMQLSEEWILIHDDYEDDSMLRRGLPALHRLYSPPLAINAGDALHELMWKALSDNRTVLDTQTTFGLIDEMHSIISRTILGQTVDIKWAQDNKTDFTDADWSFIADSKTSYYTIAGPMRLGAIIAHANATQIDAITDFGVVLGKCFQLVDDLLDLTSNFAGQKNQIGNDLYEGKRTIMLGHLLRSANSQDKNQLISILEKTRDQKTPLEVVWILDLMHQYGSIDYGKTLAETYKAQALDIFENQLGFLSQNPARIYLKTLIHFILTRDH